MDEVVQSTLHPKDSSSTAATVLPDRRRRIIRRKGGSSSSSRNNPNDIPESIRLNKALHEAITSSLPKDYEFEIPKTLWKIQQVTASHVALQMPEGLLMYGCILADILHRFSSTVQRTTILGDVTYGACCIDDLGAEALGADLLVHYGHSCLVPINKTVIPCLYVFVEIHIDTQHLVDCVCQTFEEGTQIELMGTIQFRGALGHSAKLLTERNRHCNIPQAKPLSPGEVLGCTAPTISPPANSCSNVEENGIISRKVIVFVADGRFHLEAAMIANPSFEAFRYDPYSKLLTQEWYDTTKMKKLRHQSILKARSASTFGIILGTLGRQGNPAIVGRIRSLLHQHEKKSIVVLLSEIFPNKLDMFPQVDAWVQVACPRLSVDWGHMFRKPLLSSHELEAYLVGSAPWMISDDPYPMDFYKVEGGPWTNYHESNRNREIHL